MDTNLIWMAGIGATAYGAIHASTRKPGSGTWRARFAAWKERTFNWVWSGRTEAVGATEGWGDQVAGWVRSDKSSGGSSVAAKAAWEALGVDTQPWPVISSPVDVEATEREPIAVHHVAPVHIMTPAEMEEARWAREWARVDDILEHDCRRSDSALFKYEGVREAYEEIHRRDDMSFQSVLREDAASITRMLVMIEAHLAVAETLQMVGV